MVVGSGEWRQTGRRTLELGWEPQVCVRSFTRRDPVHGQGQHKQPRNAMESEMEPNWRSERGVWRWDGSTAGYIRADVDVDVDVDVPRLGFVKGGHKGGKGESTVSRSGLLSSDYHDR